MDFMMLKDTFNTQSNQLCEVLSPAILHTTALAPRVSGVNLPTSLIPHLTNATNITPLSHTLAY